VTVILKHRGELVIDLLLDVLWLENWVRARRFVRPATSIIVFEPDLRVKLREGERKPEVVPDPRSLIPHELGLV
jgi:hypothetical protein